MREFTRSCRFLGWSLKIDSAPRCDAQAIDALAKGGQRMSTLNALSVSLHIFLLSILCSPSVMAEPPDADGFSGKPIPDKSGPTDVFHRKYLCPDGQFLV